MRQGAQKIADLKDYKRALSGVLSLSEAHLWLTLLVLLILELVLGVDNLVFITLASQKLPQKQQAYARRLGLLGAVFTRLILLAFAFWLIHLVSPLFYIRHFGVSARDLLLLLGGVFLIYTALKELFHAVQGKGADPLVIASRSFFAVVIKIMLFDILFSLDSVITAVGVAQDYWVMAGAIILAMVFMIVASDFLAYLIQTFWRIRLLALAFLILVGLMLLFHATHLHIDQGYLYVALFFAIFVEVINSLYEKYHQ